MSRSWVNVERRVFFLHGRSGKDLDHFVDLALSHSNDFVVWTGLARSTLTTARVAEVLGALNLTKDAGLAGHVRSSHMSAAAIVGAGALCLESSEMERLAREVEAILPWLTDGYNGAIDSLGAGLQRPPTDAYLRGLPESGFRSKKRHRLIIASTLRDKRALSLLFGGSDAVTLYSLSDLYGKADFSDEQLHCEKDFPINVENARSRVTRFSEEYHALHSETQELAKRVHKELAETGKGIDWLPTDRRIFAEMNLADRLFFPSLTLSALRKLIAQPEFDHVIIALSSRNEDRDLCAMIAGLEELKTDPRVEVVSHSTSLTERLAIPSRLAELRSGPPERKRPQDGYWGPPLSAYGRQLSDVIRDATPPIIQWTRTDEKARVLFIGAATSAYNDSTAAYLDALAKRYQTRIGFAGSNPLPVLNLLADPNAITSSDIYRLQTTLSKSQELRLGGLKAWLDDFLTKFIRSLSIDGHPSLAVHVMSVRTPYYVREALISFLIEAHLVDRWFANMKAAGALPDILVMTPYRDMFVANAAAAARRHGVRSVALEPHGLNANYCRYAMIHSDFCGVTTEAFRHESASGFGIPLERCKTVGSPRLTAPLDYDLQSRTNAARNVARNEYGYDFKHGRTVLAFFSQPTDWGQLEKVWRILLNGSAAQDVQILLKTHPEEAPTRASRYFDVAREIGVRDKVVMWKGNAKEAIECADIVLVAYSATAVEAATLRRPVVCLAPEGVDYPLEQNRIIGAPLVRTPDELARILAEFVKDPSPMQAAAAKFVSRERQVTEDIETSLARLVDEIVALPKEQALRDPRDLPESCFLSGPHRAFQV
ncbi:MAG: hypothetical protein B7Z02_11850 [Rhodobacterales bacterium 32-67-9]|nr:MAG: hypothetical protein B7Z02_11850 [Rhodobacterales bacterium 32-67-9]